MPDITFFHKTHLDDHFPVVDLYNEEHKVRWTQSLFLNENDQNVLISSLPFSFNRRKRRGTSREGFGMSARFDFSLRGNPSKSRTKEKRLKCVAADLFRVLGVFLAPCFGYLFVKTSSAPHSCNTLIKARGQRERDASVCCCSYQ